MKIPQPTHSAEVSESARQTPVVARTQVIVCGGGPAGFAAALTAARSGSETTLIEMHGQLGGVWTTGLLSWIIDYENKRGVMSEVLSRLEQIGGRTIGRDGRPSPACDAEKMKLTLETMCLEAGVKIRFHTRVVAALVDQNRRLTHIVTESKSGREAWAADVFIDCTGDGDLAARAGCGFDVGRPENGQTQPMTLLMLVTGVHADEIREFINGEGAAWGVPHRALREVMERGGVSPSYSYPSIFRIHDELFVVMSNHQYLVSALNADDLTQATIEARSELNRTVEALRSLGDPWRELKIVATGSQIGIREGRRIHGRYVLTIDDLVRGARFEDAVCRVTFCVDVHSTDPSKDKGLGSEGVKTQPYDVPLRSLIAADVDGLMMAGRCISGDFLAHASYRVTGNAVAMGEAAGRVAAMASRTHCLPHEVNLAQTVSHAQRSPSRMETGSTGLSLAKG